MTGYEFHPKALEDLDEIYEYIMRDSHDNADKVIALILRAVCNLVPFPHRGHRRTDLTSRPLRFWRLYDYLIAYAPDERPMWVVAVMHGRQSPQVMAAILKSSESIS